MLTPHNEYTEQDAQRDMEANEKASQPYLSDAPYTKPTRKQMHAEGIRFLEQAMEAADQADSCFRDANTRDCVSTRHTNSRHIVIHLEALLKAAKDATCDDCDKPTPIADCTCAWANEEVK